MATTNGSTAIRDKILASLARYRALRIGKFPCAFWRLSARPGLTALEFITSLLEFPDPGDKLKELGELIKDVFQLMPSGKHMTGRDLGRLGPTASLKYCSAG
ncbi:hypothetical protein [Bathymodiolus japonicus methanotrophic gill symbiont]|uniref:hypothetical protein n=1 Tax=Bathymodiolus japonicus methanotrophic gill symbiont TaxID=113269 RepID=UPI001C8D42E5|nr:hypothetical protein [Bathymodiolus japonicus methanotrophic gill symbiont]